MKQVSLIHSWEVNVDSILLNNKKVRVIFLGYIILYDGE